MEAKTEGPPWRVVLADDDDLFRHVLRRLIAEHEDIAVVGEAADGGAALDLVEKLAPHCVVLDLEMPVLSGREVLPLIKATAPDTDVVVLSVSSWHSDSGPQPDAVLQKGGDSWMQALPLLIETLAASRHSATAESREISSALPPVDRG